MRWSRRSSAGLMIFPFVVPTSWKLNSWRLNHPPNEANFLDRIAGFCRIGFRNVAPGMFNAEVEDLRNSPFLIRCSAVVNR